MCCVAHEPSESALSTSCYFALLWNSRHLIFFCCDSHSFRLTFVNPVGTCSSSLITSWCAVLQALALGTFSFARYAYIMNHLGYIFNCNNMTHRGVHCYSPNRRSVVGAACRSKRSKLTSRAKRDCREKTDRILWSTWWISFAGASGAKLTSRAKRDCREKPIGFYGRHGGFRLLGKGKITPRGASGTEFYVPSRSAPSSIFEP